jgi:hypothetical protein
MAPFGHVVSEEDAKAIPKYLRERAKEETAGR